MKGLYFYRNVTIMRKYDGWAIDIDSYVYKTIKDAKNAINKHLDGSHSNEPRIIGYLDYSEYPEVKYHKM